jgi:hypothetical protein
MEDSSAIEDDDGGSGNSEATVFDVRPRSRSRPRHNCPPRGAAAASSEETVSNGRSFGARGLKRRERPLLAVLPHRGVCNGRGGRKKTRDKRT